MSDPVRRPWGAILRGVPLTTPGETIVTHPNATLDAQAARLATARHNTNRLHLEIQATDMRFRTATDGMRQEYEAEQKRIEDHYHGELDKMEVKFKAKMADLQTQYREAWQALRREQAAFVEQVKHHDGKLEFVDHFPPPKGDADV